MTIMSSQCIPLVSPLFLATAQWDPLPQNDFVATVNEAIRDAVTALTTGMLIALQV